MTPRWAMGLLVLSGCALGTGDPFAVLEPRLRASFDERADRTAGGGWQRLSSEFQVNLDAFEVTFEPFALYRSAPVAQSFDPANPPPGYSNCHGGHCHSDQGALVPYEEIAAGGSSGAPTLSLSGSTENLLSGEARALTCEASCELPAGSITLLRSKLSWVRLSGRVRDGRAPARLSGERAFLFERRAAPDEPAIGLSGQLELVADRREPPLVELELRFTPGAALFDGLDFERLGQSAGVLDLAADAQSHEALEEGLEQLVLATDVTRRHYPR